MGRQASGESEKLLLPVEADAEGPPEPAAYDRLPLEWNKRTVARFKERLAERGVEAFLVRDPLNPGFPFWPWHGHRIHPRCAEYHVFSR